MNDLMRALRSLGNVFQSIQFDNPAMAATMREDIMEVSLHALSADNSPAKEAAERLRRKAFVLPVIQARVLEGALNDLGF